MIHGARDDVPMTREQAKRKYDTLTRMTTANGCSSHEAATAKRLAATLAAKFGFDSKPHHSQYRDDFSSRFARAEKRAAIRWNWEYRRCGKRNCHCAKGGRHGPYKYSKRREGKKVVSVYIGL